jgi:hypothetical protein
MKYYSPCLILWSFRLSPVGLTVASSGLEENIRIVRCHLQYFVRTVLEVCNCLVFCILRAFISCITPCKPPVIQSISVFKAN